MQLRLFTVAAGVIVSGLAVLSLAASLPAANVASTTFTKDVAPVIFANCVNCHRPGEVAPFSLTNYKEVKKRASQIADVVDDKIMPPWKAVAGHGNFIGERRLSDEQIKMIRAWADAGAPEGDPAALPALPTFAEGWTLGEPDLVVKMPEAFTVKAEGRDVFRWFCIPLDIPEDKYVTAVDFRPSNRKIVHHALFFLDSSGKARKLDAEDPAPGWARGGGGGGFSPAGGLGGWSPGVTPRFLPDGIARPLKKGQDIVLQMHFHPTGKDETEQSTLGLYFAKKPPEKFMISFPKAVRGLNIPAGDNNFVVNDSFTVPLGVTLVGITPHAHLLCKEIKVDATLPSGEKIPLIWIKNWDWNWQDQYLYQDAIKIPGGTKVDLMYRYDNSSANPANPNKPPVRVTWGEQTTNEMAITFFQVVTDRDNGLLAGGRREGRAAAGAGAGGLGGGAPGGGVLQEMLLKRFDKNGNGKLDPDEQEEARKTLRREFGAGNAPSGDKSAKSPTTQP